MTTGASALGTRCAYTALAAVVSTPAVSMLSLSASGMPCSGPRLLPAASSVSSARACASAGSAVTVMYAFTRGFSRSIRSKYARVSATGESSREAIRRAASAIVSVVRSVDAGGCACARAPAASVAPAAAAARTSRRLSESVVMVSPFSVADQSPTTGGSAASGLITPNRAGI